MKEVQAGQLRQEFAHTEVLEANGTLPFLCRVKADAWEKVNL
jgi:hypothetical protein